MTTAPVVSITDELLAELEEAAKAATPGPWGWDGPVWAYDPAEEAPWLIAEATGDPIVHGEIECNERNALFLSLSHPATVLALVEEVRRLRRWKSSNMKVMGPVLDYAQGLQIAPLGTSCTKALIADHARLAAIEAAGIRIKP